MPLIMIVLIVAEVALSGEFNFLWWHPTKNTKNSFRSIILLDRKIIILRHFYWNGYIKKLSMKVFHPSTLVINLLRDGISTLYMYAS